MGKPSVFFGLFLLFVYSASGQLKISGKPVLKVAIVAPLSISSAFENGLIAETLPKDMSSGLDFIQGAEIALDTINLRGKALEVHIIDSKDSVRDMDWLLRFGGLDKMDLIIGNTRPPEFQKLASFAESNGIPFVSAIYPNDGGIRKDSLLLITNSTLQTHLQGIYSYIVQMHGSDQILLIKQPKDNRISDFFNEINQGTGRNLLKIKTVEVDSLTPGRLARLIDTLKPTVVIGASLDEQHATNIADACYPFRKNITLIGMPNWNTFPALFDKERYADFPIQLTTPHFVKSTNIFGQYLENRYFTAYRARPGDIASKGFEATYFFVNVLINHPDQFWEHIHDKQYASLHTYNFKKVSFEKNGQMDYYENNHLFIVKILNGNISQVD